MVYSRDLKSLVERHAGSSPASRTTYRRNCMTTKETLDKAYGNMPREVGYAMDWHFLPTLRGVKYYWYKLIRKMQGRGTTGCDCGHNH